MSNSVLYMSMSLDGFIAGPDDGPGQGLGAGGEVPARLARRRRRRPPGLPPCVGAERGRSSTSSWQTGAVLVGRRTFDIAGRWNGDHHDGVPIFVPTRGEPPEPIADRVHYVTDGVESAMAQAKAAAGDANVMVHGAELAQSLPARRRARRDRDPPDAAPARRRAGGCSTDERAALELTRVLDAPGVTHLRYRVAS